MTAELRAAHTPPAKSHVGCDACHSPDIVTRLLPDRSFCLTCHGLQRDHNSTGECTVCHFQATPDAFRGRLRKGTEGS